MWTGVMIMLKVVAVLFLGLIGLVLLIMVAGLIATILGALLEFWEERNE